MSDRYEGGSGRGGARRKLGIVGAGWISTVYHLPILDSMDRVELAYIADIDGTKARYASDAYGGEAIETGDPSDLPDCDVALLAIPVGARTQYIEELGQRGSAVFCEKPFAMNTAMHESFLEALEDIFCNYQRTCYSAVNQVRTLVDSRTFGALEEVVIHEGMVGGADKGIGPGHYRTDLSLSGGGVLIEVGCHGLSEIVHILDGWKLAVEAADIVWNAEFDTDVEATIVASSGNRTVPVDFRVSTIRNLGKRARFSFENGEVRFNPFDSETPLAVQTDGEERFAFELDESWATTHHQGVYLRWQQFLDDVDGEKTRPHVRTAPEVTELIDGIYGQADRTRPLEVEW